MRINRNFNRRFRNADQGNGNQSAGATSFSTASDPFSQSGNNVFDQMAAKKAGPAENMNAPAMGNGNMPAGAQQQPPAAATTPANTSTQSASPLDKFSPQSHNDPTNQPAQQQGQQQAPAPQAPATQPAPAAQSIFDNTLENYQAHMSKQQNVAGTIDPEVAKAALSGDMDALSTLLNVVAQNAVAMSMHGSGRIAQQGMNANMEGFRSEVPTMITDHQVSNVFQNDTTMNHPALKPMVDGAMSMFRNQFPEASPQELQTKVQEYLQATSKVLLEQAGGQVTDPNNASEANNSQSNNALTSFFGN